MATIVTGELPRSFDPMVSEWGNPLHFMKDLTPKCFPQGRLYESTREPPELKHLSRARNINQLRDSVSSGERKRNSLNLCA